MAAACTCCLLLSGVEVKNECICTSSSPTYLHAVHRDRFTFFLLLYFVSSFAVHKVSCVFLCSDDGEFECSRDTAQEDGIFHRWTGPRSEPPAPVHGWTTAQLTGLA